MRGTRVNLQKGAALHPTLDRIEEEATTMEETAAEAEEDGTAAEETAEVDTTEEISENADLLVTFPSQRSSTRLRTTDQETPTGSTFSRLTGISTKKILLNSSVLFLV